jgi:hypothetical protein
MERPKCSQPIELRDDQMVAEVLKHPLAVVSFAKLDRR